MTNHQFCCLSIGLLFLLFRLMQGQNDGTIQLIRNGVASSSFSSGRVRVWFSSQWGNICGDKTTSPFTLTEGDVACRQFGHTGASSTTIASEDSYGSDLNPILVDQFDCSSGGPYTVLFQCSFNSIINEVNCDENDDVGVSCYINRLWDDPFAGMVRLMNGSYSSEGIVEVFCNGIWSTLCGGASSDDANTICTQLGYKGAQETAAVSSISKTQWFDALSCPSAGSCINTCQSCPDTESTPSHSCATDTYVKCHYSSPSAKGGATIYDCTSDYYPRGEGAVRLARGNLYSQEFSSGRVQVYFNGVWGNVCRLGGFSSSAADVVCRQIGWTGASAWSYSSTDSFPVDVRVAHYDNVDCSTSQYLTLQQCSYRWDTVDPQCTNDNDVSIVCYSTRIWDAPFRGMIRLVGTNFVNEGRLEVYCNGEWGTVCTQNFDSNDKKVICQQLGYNQWFETTDLSLVSANSSVPVWLDNMACLDSDTYKCVLNCEDCPTTPSTNSLCSSHNADVDMQCYIDPDISAISQDFGDCQATDNSIGDPFNGAMILQRQGLDSTSFSSGIVVLLYNGQWGNICEGSLSSFSSAEADVVCHQMTYTGASSYTFDNNHDFGTDSRREVIEDMSCTTGNELTILQCAYSEITDLCDSSNELAVTCYELRLWDNPFPGMVRLMEGDFTSEGRVEVYCSGRWGSVCADTFDLNDASAVCRQLGYTTATKVAYRDLPGSDATPVWLDNLQCQAKPDTPTCISTCQLCPTDGQESTKCTHSSKATVQCSHGGTRLPSGLNNACLVDSNLPGVAQSGAIFLGRNGNYSRSYTSGRVLINYNRRWGTICEKDSNHNLVNEADVICHHLTFSGASSWSYAEVDGYGSDPLPVLFTDMSCSDSSYLTVFQCSLSTTLTDCTMSNAISVECYTSRLWDNPFDSSVRLSKGNFVNEGLLEVYCNGEWGTVCGDTLAMSSAGSTACRQLGYHSYTSDHGITLTGSADQKIWLDQLSCTDASDCLKNCQQCPTSESDECSHSQDVTIQCAISDNFEEESNNNNFESCLHIPNYLIYIIAGSCGGAVLILIVIISIICCFRIQRDKGKCPKPCGKWEVEIDEANAGPLSISMRQKHRRTLITLPAESPDDPPPYDLTNAPTLPLDDPNAPPMYDPTNAAEHLAETVNPMSEEEQDEAITDYDDNHEDYNEDYNDEELPHLDGLDNVCY